MERRGFEERIQGDILMLVNRADTSMMDISKFQREAKQNYDLSEFCVHTEHYTLMKKEYYDYLVGIAEKHGEPVIPIETYSVHGKPVKLFSNS